MWLWLSFACCVFSCPFLCVFNLFHSSKCLSLIVFSNETTLMRERKVRLWKIISFHKIHAKRKIFFEIRIWNAIRRNRKHLFCVYIASQCYYFYFSIWCVCVATVVVLLLLKLSVIMMAQQFNERFQVEILSSNVKAMKKQKKK